MVPTRRDGFITRNLKENLASSSAGVTSVYVTHVSRKATEFSLLSGAGSRNQLPRTVTASRWAHRLPMRRGPKSPRHRVLRTAWRNGPRDETGAKVNSFAQCKCLKCWTCADGIQRKSSSGAQSEIHSGGVR